MTTWFDDVHEALVHISIIRGCQPLEEIEDAWKMRSPSELKLAAGLGPVIDVDQFDVPAFEIAITCRFALSRHKRGVNVWVLPDDRVAYCL